MGETKKSSVGRFVWHEVMCTDPARARGFYTELFGWKVQEHDMGPGGRYTMFLAGEQGLGGIVKLEGAGVRSHWIPYVDVESVDAACARAKELGGKACVPPTDIPEVGRFAVLEDPEGAIVSPFSEKTPMPPSDALPAPWTFCWDELLARDPASAVRYYTALFGWKTHAMDMGPMGTYTVLKAGERDVGGIAKAPQGVPRPHWLSHVAVDDLDAVVARAQRLGGTVQHAKTEVPGMGHFAVLLDPTGAVFSAFQGAK